MRKSQAQPLASLYQLKDICKCIFMPTEWSCLVEFFDPKEQWVVIRAKWKLNKQCRKALKG